MWTCGVVLCLTTVAVCQWVKTASLMHTGPFGCKEKGSQQSSWFIRERRGTRVGALLLLQCLFVAEELAGPRGRLTDNTHTYTHTHGTLRLMMMYGLGALRSLLSSTCQEIAVTQADAAGVRGQGNYTVLPVHHNSSSAKNSATLQLLEQSIHRLPGPYC